MTVPISRRLIVRSGEQNLGGWRLPAAVLETAVVNLIATALATQASILSLVQNASTEMLRNLPTMADALVTTLNGPDRGSMLRAVVVAGRIEPGQLSVTLNPAAIAGQLGVPPACIKHDALTLTGAFTLRRRGVETRLVFNDTSSGVDKTLLKNLGQGWVWLEEIKAGVTMQAIAERNDTTQRRVASLVDLAFLAPDIVQAIVDGRQPATLTANSLIRARHRPLWADQRVWISAF